MFSRHPISANCYPRPGDRSAQHCGHPDRPIDNHGACTQTLLEIGLDQLAIRSREGLEKARVHAEQKSRLLPFLFLSTIARGSVMTGICMAARKLYSYLKQCRLQLLTGPSGRASHFSFVCIVSARA